MAALSRLSRWRGVPWFVLLAASCTAAVAACEDVPPPTVLHPLDTAPPEFEIAPFDANQVVADGDFTDTTSLTLDVTAIQEFLAKTPYSRSSFLVTYQSNGVRASDAIVAAARQYRINPLVFLVFTEITQGLVAARTYRFPPERVEYIFGCGCTGPDDCLPQLAGYDRQLACLGQALRSALDEIRVNDRAPSGWGPGITNTTLDNVEVTPANDATAALYDRLPRVNSGGDSGTWAFWKVWQLYATALNYTGAQGGTSDGAWIGAACSANAMCSAVQDGICASDFPGGLCTVKCDGSCPSEPGRPETFCAKFPDSGYCLAVCNPAAPACRTDYQCVRATGVAGDSQYVCTK